MPAVAGRNTARSVCPRGGWPGWPGWPLPVRSSSRCRCASERQAEPTLPAPRREEISAKPRCRPRGPRAKGQGDFAAALYTRGRGAAGVAPRGFSHLQTGAGRGGAYPAGMTPVRGGRGRPGRARGAARGHAAATRRGSAREKGTRGVAACHG